MGLYPLRPRSCYISCFYIKPQRRNFSLKCVSVATFLVSTSNRNQDPVWCCPQLVATFLVSTSNRNVKTMRENSLIVATFLVSTSNRNLSARYLPCQAVATFLVSTSNRNQRLLFQVWPTLLHFLFLHQTATPRQFWRWPPCCYISCFYIKPQLFLNIFFLKLSCYISCFYIKPQQEV